jgi:hypothetical protein
MFNDGWDQQIGVSSSSEKSSKPNKNEKDDEDALIVGNKNKNKILPLLLHGNFHSLSLRFPTNTSCFSSGLTHMSSKFVPLPHLQSVAFTAFTFLTPPFVPAPWIRFNNPGFFFFLYRNVYFSFV